MVIMAAWQDVDNSLLKFLCPFRIFTGVETWHYPDPCFVMNLECIIWKVKYDTNLLFLSHSAPSSVYFSHPQHLAKSDPYSCRSIMPKNVLASHALFSSLLHCEFGSNLTKNCIGTPRSIHLNVPVVSASSVFGVRPISEHNLCLG